MEQLLEENDLRAILFCRPDSFSYFTTLPWYEWRFFAPNTSPNTPGNCPLPVSGYVTGHPEMAFGSASSQMDLPDFEAQGIWISDIRRMLRAPYERHAEEIVKILNAKDVRSGRVGIERASLPHGLISALDKVAPSIDWVEGEGIILKLQEFKCEEEVRRMATSCQNTGKGIVKVLNHLAEGVTAEELMDIFVRSVAGLYAERWGHFFCIHFGDNHFTGRELKGARLEPGTLIHIDVTTIHKGLISDMGRNFYFGDSVPPEVERMSQACNETVQTVFDRLRPGISCSEVDELSKEVLFSHIGDAEGLHVGFHSHGIGWIMYDVPHVSMEPGPKGEILPGHAFTLEVKIKAPGIGHFKCEDTFVMRETGPECLCDLERKLFVKSA